MTDSPTNNAPRARGLGRGVAIVTRSLLGVIALAVAIGVYVLLVQTRPEIEAADPDRYAMRLAAYPVRPVPVRRQWVGYGTAEAKRAADVPARVTAVVIDVPEGVEEGRRVEAGDTLVALDPEDYQQELEAARQSLADLRAQLDQLDVERRRLEDRVEIEERDFAIAEREVERLRGLLDRSAANQQDVDARERERLAVERSLVQSREQLERIPSRRAGLEARVAAQRAAVEAARLALDRTTVASPIAGEIQSVDVEIGESVAPGQRVARVVDPAVIEVPLKLPAGAASSVGVGDTVELTDPDDDRRVWGSTLVRIAPEQDPRQRTITVYAEVEQGNRNGVAEAVKRLAPGMFLEGRVSRAEAEPRWVVPRRAVRRGRVFVIEDGVVRSRGVERAFEVEQRLPATGLDDDFWVVVRGGGAVFDRGELVALNASSQLADGQRAEVEVMGTPATDAAAQSNDRNQAKGDAAAEPEAAPRLRAGAGGGS